ncbi:fibrinogen C domain-containing protein 1-like [Mytilus trossulus]|uniref:fibrinogen C domain-containing protein 1-like n=1 Tax=Mytilus trossulus TaxID=6551 RepID=UPI003004A49A
MTYFERNLTEYINETLGKKDGENEKSIHRPLDCEDVKTKKGNGIYKIYPNHSEFGFDVYCDFEIDNGGWTVFQRRINGKTDFYRGWEAYENGFGDLEAEFWLGNQKINDLTSQGKYELRLEISDFNGNKRFAKYSSFLVGNITTKYELKISGYSGNAGDCMTYNSGMSFSTKDRDNDLWSLNCAVNRYGAWWYKSCTHANLNGQYLKGGTQSSKGLYWWKWKTTNYSMKSTVMMIRKLNKL